MPRPRHSDRRSRTPAAEPILALHVGGTSTTVAGERTRTQRPNEVTVHDTLYAMDARVLIGALVVLMLALLESWAPGLGGVAPCAPARR